MTLSRLPWSLEATDAFAYLKDADGRQIAKFTNWQDAEHVLTCLANPEQIATLESKIEELTRTIKG